MKDFAYYYPYPIWEEGAWIKSLLLFFDGIAVLLPSYGRNKPVERDPAIALPLQEQGLLQVLEAEEFIDRAAATRMVEAMTAVLGAGALDSLSRDPAEFHTLSYSRLGYMAEPEQAEALLLELERRGFANRAEEHVWIHPEVRLAILLLWAQLLRPNGQSVGLDLEPITDHPEIVAGLRQLLNLPKLSSSGHVVATDLESVGVDLRLVPLDEVLDFKRQHGRSFSAYRRGLREFVRDVGLAPPHQRDALIRDRRQEIADSAADLRRLTSENWKGLGTVGLGCAGGAWQLSQGDPIGALVTVGSAALTASILSRSPTVDAYNYLFKIHQLR